MELYTEVPGVIGKLNYFDQICVRVSSACHHPTRLKLVDKQIVDFVAVTMPLYNIGLTVYVQRTRFRPDSTGIGAQPHCTTQISNFLLFLHNVNHRELRLIGEL